MRFADALRAPTDRTQPRPGGSLSARRLDAGEMRLRLDDIAFDLALVAHEAAALEPAAARSLRAAIGKLGVIRQVFDTPRAMTTSVAA